MKAINEKTFADIQSIIRTELENQIIPHVIRDQGTCIMGEGIEVETKFKRERLVRPRMVYSQQFTQGSQLVAMQKLKSLLETYFPELKFRINYGRMD